MSVEGGPCIPLEEHRRLLAEAEECVNTLKYQLSCSRAEIARLRMVLGERPIQTAKKEESDD